MKMKSKSKAPITIAAAPKKPIFVKSLNGRAMQIDFAKQEPQLREYTKGNLPKMNNDITDAD